jgi:hypothetical protein
MRYLFAVMAEVNGTITADAGEMAAIDAFNEKLRSRGHLVMAAGVATPDKSMVFDDRDGRGSTVDGPAVNSELFMAGFWVIDASDDAVARALATEASRACNRIIEMRPFLG